MATLTLWLQGKFVFCYSLDPDVAQQNVVYSDGIPERTTFVKSNVEKYLHLKMLPALYICCINSSAFQPFFIEANNLNHGQPAIREII